MNRVVITGMGIVSCIGNDLDSVEGSLREGLSGMVYLPEMEELSYRCCVFGPVTDLDPSAVPHTLRRSMSQASIYAAVATLQALDDAGLSREELASDDPRDLALVIGSGGGGVSDVPRAEEAHAAGKKIARMGSVTLAKIMNTTASASLSAYLGVQGRSCSLSAACATGLYNIGHAFELIQRGVATRCITGSCEEPVWKQVGLSADNSFGMPADFNDRPESACRPFDRDRQGLVLSEGAGILVLEELERARARGARIYAEVVAYGAANDGGDIFVPNSTGLQLAIGQALKGARRASVAGIDYVNAHGAGTIIGDRVESEVLRATIGEQPYVGSTKSLSGHSQGATASQEVVYTTLMLARGFVAPTRNLENIAEDCATLNYAQSLVDAKLETAMTVNSGLGGTNACLVMRRL